MISFVTFGSAIYLNKKTQVNSAANVNKVSKIFFFSLLLLSTIQTFLGFIFPLLTTGRGIGVVIVIALLLHLVLSVSLVYFSF